ncbi:hypothetical protein OIDMADRAFT_16359 [Oidiodendron maius Zn]|uniref:Uncharacterized protein n=1 Tax=Oidiodendron maius (strain Zn) TaxID=913774 RepID=A0A0C3I086_OIDMZ|nr:hypothetical protein OIDMADRAFT_16359 [Oidiodendron maius Zn]
MSIEKKKKKKARTKNISYKETPGKQDSSFVSLRFDKVQLQRPQIKYPALDDQDWWTWWTIADAYIILS